MTKINEQALRGQVVKQMTIQKHNYKAQVLYPKMNEKWLKSILDEDQDQIQMLFDQHYMDIIQPEEAPFPCPCCCDGLMVAAFLNKQQSIRTLSYLKLQKNITSLGEHQQMTALMLAAARDNYECIDQLQFLLNRKSKTGLTALMIAAIYNSYNSCSTLAPYESGQIVLEETKYAYQGKTALELALYYKNKDSVQILLPWEVNINQYNVFQQLLQNGYIQTSKMNQSPTISMTLDGIVALNKIIQKHIQTQTQDPYLTPITKNTIQLNNTLQLSAIQNVNLNNQIIDIIIEDDNQKKKQQSTQKRQHHNRQQRNKNRRKHNYEEINIIIPVDNDKQQRNNNTNKQQQFKNQKQNK